MTPFEQLVLEMRQVQKEYFRTFSIPALQQSKRLEWQVDAELQRLAIFEAPIVEPVKCNGCGCVIKNVIPGPGCKVYCATCMKGLGYG